MLSLRVCSDLSSGLKHDCRVEINFVLVVLPATQALVSLVASKKFQHVEVGGLVRKAHEMYSLSIRVDQAVDREDSTRNPLSLDVRSVLLVRLDDESKSHSDSWGDTPHRVECSASEQ